GVRSDAGRAPHLIPWPHPHAAGSHLDDPLRPVSRREGAAEPAVTPLIASGTAPLPLPGDSGGASRAVPDEAVRRGAPAGSVGPAGPRAGGRGRGAPAGGRDGRGRGARSFLSGSGRWARP